MNEKIYDLVVVGAGPSALTAAIYAAREDISTLLIEKGVIGGLMATIDKIENYPGFPDGIEGLNLAMDFQAQAEKFGAKIELAEVKKITRNSAQSEKSEDSPRDSSDLENPQNDKNSIFEIETDGEKYRAKTVLISTGCNYRHLGIPNENEFAHYCATCDGAFFRDKKLVVIGGANAAIQEAMFLTKFATHVDLLVRSWVKASDVLKKELQDFIENGKISLFEGTTPDEIVVENGEVVAVAAHKTSDENEKMKFACDGVFVFAGVIPNTEFLRDFVRLDDAGHVLTDAHLMTDVAGIFASGDCRSGAEKQVVSAAGEGANAALAIREYLGKIKR